MTPSILLKSPVLPRLRISSIDHPIPTSFFSNIKNHLMIIAREHFSLQFSNSGAKSAISQEVLVGIERVELSNYDL